MKIFYLTIGISLIISSLCVPLITRAEVELEIEYPTVQGQHPDKDTTLPEYIKYIYTLAMSIVGIAAVVALMYGGFQYMLGDTITSKDEGKAWIRAALTGLILALASFLILYTINPELVYMGMKAH